MIDFLMIATRTGKQRDTIEIYPKFVIKKSSDLMIRGGDFYAIWVAERGLWSTDEQDALQLIDNELDRYATENKSHFDGNVRVLHMWDSESGMIDRWHKYCQKQMRDSFHMLDEKLIFSNMETKKSDYASKKLPYPLEDGDISSYDKLMSVLYSEEERRKIEWAIGSIVSGHSKKLQKFLVLYGAAGTGKSTVLNIIQQLFDGYYSVFDAKSLGSSSSDFALEAFRTNPLVAIQHDGDLSRIEDNTRLNSLVSHELMTVNEKFKSTYTNRFKAFLFMGTNRPVKITDAKSGLIRRLIDVSPTGNKLSLREYKKATTQIAFELGAIAYHCQQVYLDDPGRYDDYIPVTMLGASNDFYNFVVDSYYIFKNDDGTTMKAAWEMYKTYCEEAKVPYQFSQRIFKEELKNYFRNYDERFSMEDGTRVRSWYSGFRTEKFVNSETETVEESDRGWIDLKDQPSIFDKYCADFPAQYASDAETPKSKWKNVTTRLEQIDTSKIHYVKVPENLIVIDFDIPDTNGKKDFEANLREANKWPETYAETSKSGSGIHLHYLYSGDPQKLSRVFGDHIEIKVFSGDSSLRRKLTLCNDIPIATISSGLPLKGEKMVKQTTITSEKSLRRMIKRNLDKEIHPGTKPSVDFIYKILEDAYQSGMPYDVTNMRNAVLAFAAGSTHQAETCIKLVNKMHFKSAETGEPEIDISEDRPIVFYDVEVFPNLFIVNWKYQGAGKSVVRMINPTSQDIEKLFRYRLVGFNCRRYDNHILYARLMGYSNEQLYKLSKRIIEGDRTAFFGEAYNLSWTDVYDFCSKKQSLKKWEIELGIHHKELGLPWDQPVPEELWSRVAEYCDNDVLATEATFDANQADFTARQILADLAGLTVNDTTNTLTGRIIFGDDRKPNSQFQYRNMGILEGKADILPHELINEGVDPLYTVFKDGKPIFPGYIYEKGVSTYRGIEVGEGGYVFATPGMYGNVALLDVESMHPHSAIAENLFGKYTKNFNDILQARLAIKHKDYNKAKKLFGGRLAKYLTDEASADSLSKALKIAINSVYGLTSAKFDNLFRDKRNVDNIVAKRGALFMINLQHEVQKRGYTVAHIKTDSIKIPDATPSIIDFVCLYGKIYGYHFEHEATYDRMCLVNDAVYIAKYATVDRCIELYGEKYVNSTKDTLKDCKKHGGEWTATGTQFQVPYVFKTLFSKEPIEFHDLCETKSVTSALYLDMNEDLPKDEHNYIFVGRVGLFCPVKAGTGGGLLMRETKNNKTGEIGYAAATGTKGYRWKESETVRELEQFDDIDRTYYNKLVDAAVEAVSKYGDFEWFVSDEADGSWPLPDDYLPF